MAARSSWALAGVEASMSATVSAAVLFMLVLYSGPAIR
jgi:hypothetical protein